MSDTTNPFPGADVWMKFWTDAMAKFPGMAGGAAAPPPPNPAMAPSEMLSKMQQAFLQAWAKSIDEYMRSEAFLAMMKKSMENALSFRQHMDDFLRKTLHAGQAPSRADTGDIMQFLHSFEGRVLDQLADLARRVDALEAGGARSRPAAGKAS